MQVRSQTELNVRRTCSLLTVAGIGALIWAAIEIDALFSIGAVFITLILVWAGIATGGSQFTLMYNLFGLRAPKMEIKTNYIAPGWEGVREAFNINLRRGIEAGGQVTVWHKGEVVVNYCGTMQSRSSGAEDLSKYDEDSMQLVWSTSKVLTSLVAAILVDRGCISYDTKIVDVWPEFTAHGREELRFVDVLKHEAGLARLPTVDVEDFSREAIRRGDTQLEKHFAEAKRKYNKPDLTDREYHAITRGFLVNAICVRVDPQKRTVGEVLRDEVTKPLGVHHLVKIGLPADDPLKSYHVQTNVPQRTAWLYANFCVPRCLRLPFWCVPTINRLFCIAYWGDSKMNKLKLNVVARDGDKKIYRFFDFMTSDLVKQGEIPSANAHCAAKGLAAIGNELVHNKGALFFKNPASFELAQANKTLKATPPFSKPTTFTNAGWGLFDEHFIDLDGMIGWPGFSESVLGWWEKEDVAWSYCPTMMGDPKALFRMKNIAYQVIAIKNRLHAEEASGKGGVGVAVPEEAVPRVASVASVTPVMSGVDIGPSMQLDKML